MTASAGRTVRVLDGGMGRELLRIGAPFRQPEWSALALLEGPEWVVHAHRNFIDAGAEVITTNSYAVVPFHLGEERFAEEGQRLAELSGRLARQAVVESGRDVTVVGSLPPLFGSYEPDRFDAPEAAAIIDPLIAGLASHVDGWLAETLSAIAEAEAVGAALGRAGGRAAELPRWISFTLDDATPGRLRSGESVEHAVAAAIELGAAAVLFNCSQAEAITAALPIALRLVDGRNIVLGGYANRFAAHHAEGTHANEGLSALRSDLDPGTYAEVVDGWLDAGAAIVGGCCGMEPEHIARLSALVRDRS